MGEPQNLFITAHSRPNEDTYIVYIDSLMHHRCGKVSEVIVVNEQNNKCSINNLFRPFRLICYSVNTNNLLEIIYANH